MLTIKESCREIYNQTSTAEKQRLFDEALSKSRSGQVSDEKLGKIETEAQKEAIKKATVETTKAFPGEEMASIWKAVYEVHIHRKSGIDDADTSP